MKTTVEIDDILLAAAKELAAQRRTTLARLIEEGLQLRLKPQKAPERSASIPVFAGKGGLCTGLDGHSNNAMLATADHDA